MLQDGERLGAWLAAWAPGEPLLPPTPPHPLACPAADCKPRSSQHPSPLASKFWWHQTECVAWCLSISVRPPAPPSFGVPQCFPLHPCSVLAELPHPAQTGWTWWSWGCHQPLQSCGMARTVLGWSWSLPVLSPGPSGLQPL